MPTIPKITIYKSVILSILVIFIGISIQLFTASTSIEEKVGLDTLFKLRGSLDPPTEVAIVAIDKVASSHYGFNNEPLSWSRDYHARIINNLNAAGARVIAFDIFFKQARDKKHDLVMATTIKQAGNVVLFAKLRRELLNISGQTPKTLSADNIFSIETIHAPLALFKDSALAVAPFTLPKFPAKVTRFWTFRSTSGDTPTIPLIALHYYLQADLNAYLQKTLPALATNISLTAQAKQLRDGLSSNDKEYAQLKNLISSQNKTALLNLLSAYVANPQPYLNFYGPPRTIKTLTYDQVLENNLPADFSFKNKAVFVGFSEKLEPEQKDNFHTVFSQANGLDLSGIEIAATAFSNLLHNSTIKPLSTLSSLLIIIGFGFIIAFVSRMFRETVAISLWFILSVGYLYIAFYQFNEHTLWLPLFVPLLVQAPLALVFGISWYALDSYRARKKLHQAFSYYVPETMVDLLTEQKQPIQHSQTLQYGICMATDAEQYTQLAEKLSPNDLAELMNQYYETLFSIVRQHSGIVSDIIGDAMLALWLPLTAQASQGNIEIRIQACLTALEIVKAHNKKYTINNQTLILPTRIGLHAGEMMVGNVGAVDHYEYRAVGDVVNTTNRIEGLNKYFSTYLLASEEVMTKTDQFLARNIGSFILPGKHNAITLYEIIQLKANASDAEQQKVERFRQALTYFRQGLFKEAEIALVDICKSIPTDGVARFYLQQCKQQRTIATDGNLAGESLTNKDWDGTITIDKK
ncbi:Adenylate cyclase [hydrothermal vent metagenome]|uniref:Adenylate cyclase n=1 Tax=hydrothermal vent metagenome TaxID=652676 RepID=A0A3B1AD40_9ZZZZ